MLQFLFSSVQDFIMYQEEKEPKFIQVGQEKFLDLKKKIIKCIKKKEKTKKKENNDPKAIYEEKVVPLLKLGSGVFGFRIFDPDYKMTVWYKMSVFSLIIYAIVNASNIWEIRNDDFDSICYCIITWSFGFTGFMFWVTIFQNRILYCDLLKIIYDFADNLDRESENEEIEKYKKNCNLCWKLIILVSFCCIVSGFIGITYPAPIYYYSGKLVLAYGFHIPGFSYSSNPGYAINYTYQIFLCIITIIGIMLLPLQTYIMLVSNASFQIDNLTVKLRKLNKSIDANPNKDGHESQLRDIIELHQQYQSYLGMVDEAFNTTFFFNLACYTFMTILALYGIVRTPWFPGYYCISMYVFELIFIPCAIGTYVELKNDELIDEVYCVSWYSLTPKERKPFKLFLLGVQGTSMLSLKYLPLNVNTFGNTYSNIYTYLMFLLDTHHA